MQGAGILVMPGVVLTCAHVVASAVGAGRDRPAAAPAGPVLIDAPGYPDSSAGAASVVPGGWFPGPLSGGSEGDLAVLRTAWSPPEDLLPARVGPCGDPDRREVSAYGHPPGVPDGLWASARLAGRGGPQRDWIQLEGLSAAGARIGHGFSGAGVWDPAGRRVIGMITAAYTDQQAKVAWMLPLEAAARMWPPLSPTVGPPGSATPQRVPKPPSDKDQFALADALLDVPLIEEDGAAALRRLLPTRIRRTLRSSPRLRLQLFYIVQGCADHRGGRQALLDALRLLDDESAPASAALGLFKELWPTTPGDETP
ncbi:trypsin-like peptidase domain-containing protein [Streptomyces sp. NPDC059037]|uniref:effector-associated domain 2-containing protein n=1 Tax=Streptomyces sp. NPDC059037 TaxID=3346710 RepID=UPI0036750F6C